MRLAGSWLSDIGPLDIVALIGFVALIRGCYLAWEPLAYLIGGGLMMYWVFRGNHGSHN